MKAKRFKIRLQTPAQTLDEFEKTWELISSRKKHDIEQDDDLVLYFTDLSMVSKVLSPERLRLIQVIQERRPESVNQLASMLGRAQANVHKDVHYLSELGILELKRVKKAKGPDSVQPKCRWTGFDIDLSKKKAS